MTKSQRDKIYKEFLSRYTRPGVVGVLKGGDWEPVTLGPLCLAINAIETRRVQYGCLTPDAILVDWRPVGTSRVPSQSKWLLFPTEYKGLKVYYKRGQVAKALKP